MSVLPPDLTLLLRAWQEGNNTVTDQVFSQIYHQLSAIAHNLLARERQVAMETYDLVQALFVELVQSQGITIKDRSHFFAICSRAMRRILVQQARQRDSERRGKGAADLTLDEALHSRPIALPNLDEALTELESVSEQGARQVRLIELRFFVGLSVEDAADVLGVHPQTAHRDWRLAKAWLKIRLG